MSQFIAQQNQGQRHLKDQAEFVFEKAFQGFSSFIVYPAGTILVFLFRLHTEGQVSGGEKEASVSLLGRANPGS